MSHAETYRVGNNTHPRTKTANAAVPPAQRVRPLDAAAQGRRRNSERQNEISSCGNAADGFLRTSFLPKLKETQTVQPCGKTAKTEGDFYKSLSCLAEHYGIEPMPTDQFHYPYNMALAIWDMEEKLKQRVPNWQEVRLVKDSRKTYLVSEERYDTGTTLYYIPVEPLFQMLHDPKRKRNAQLLVSVCSYLYRIADIPYFRQEGSYLYWMYEMHREWVEQDDEGEETEIYKSDFLKAELIGDCIEQKIFNPANLHVFGQRLSAFKCRDPFDRDCHQIADKCFSLYTEYPQSSIFRNAPMPEQDTEDGDGYECDSDAIGMEKYISFISHTKGWLYESICESINSEFNEYSAMQEPTIRKHFNGKDVAAASLDFERRLFAILDDMCGLLYDYQTTRK